MKAEDALHHYSNSSERYVSDGESSSDEGDEIVEAQAEASASGSMESPKTPSASLPRSPQFVKNSE